MGRKKSRTPKLSREERVQRSLAWFEERYGELFDFAEYRAAVDAHAPVDLLVAGGPDGRAALEETLAARGLRAERLPWAPWHLRVHGHASAGTLPEVVLGYAFPQGAVSSLPCLALAPEAGQRVLDVCASPGGKTILLSQLAGPGLRVLAGDPSSQRAGLIVQNMSRMGLASELVLQQDGNSFPAVARFDRILLDAPCSGEGTFRIPKPRYDPTGEPGVLRAQALQMRLLRRALDLLAPGGRLVYSTCTFAPEENEAVLSAVLAERDDINVLPLPESFPGAPGLASWRGADFDPRLEASRRLYPQMTGSWGFFLTLLEKAPSSGHVLGRKLRDDEDPAYPASEPEAHAELAEALHSRFGVPPEALDDLIVTRQARDIWVLDRLPEGSEDVQTARLRIVANGLRALRATGRGPRLTNAFLRKIGPRLRERVLELEWDDMLRFMDEPERPAPEGLGNGQVALRCLGRVVAAGYVLGDRLHLELPKAWR